MDHKESLVMQDLGLYLCPNVVEDLEFNIF